MYVLIITGCTSSIIVSTVGDAVRDVNQLSVK